MPVRIDLPESAWNALLDQADKEWRTPKQQAEYLIMRALGWEHTPAAGKVHAKGKETRVASVTAGEGRGS